MWILQLAHAAGEAQPDVMAYLTPGPPSEESFLPNEARLLGRLPVGETRRFPLDERPGRDEHLLLVSTAHGKRIGSALLGPLEAEH
jgi:hypothetical protein